MGALACREGGDSEKVQANNEIEMKKQTALIHVVEILPALRVEK